MVASLSTNSASISHDLPQHIAWSRSNLTLSQRLLWQEQRRCSTGLSASLPASLSAVLHLHGSIDMRQFRRAFQSVVDRSDALRTVLVEEDGLPQRYVLPRLPMAMDIVDLSATLQPQTAYTQWREERDLRGLSPMLRPFESTLVRLDEQHLVWRLALHRLIADSRSLLLVYRHTAAAYSAALAGAGELLPPLPLFKEYAEYERQRADDGADIAALRSSSRAGSPARPLHSWSAAGERCRVDLGVERTRRLRQFAAELTADGENTGSALFRLCAVSLAALLARLHRCDTVWIDTDMDTRHWGPWQETIGCISRPYSLSISVGQNDSLLCLLRKTGEELKEARRQMYLAPLGTRSPAACAAVLHVEDTLFPPFAGAPVIVERLDLCYGLRKLCGSQAASEKPSICLSVDSQGDATSLKVLFTVCPGHIRYGRGMEFAQEYVGLLDALLDAHEQP